MDERLSDLVDAALRWHAQRERPSARDIERAWPALAELLRDLGIFGRDMERTDALHAGDADRQALERAGAAQRLYGRLIDPPHGDNVTPMIAAGVSRFAVLDARRQ